MEKVLLNPDPTKQIFRYMVVGPGDPVLIDRAMSRWGAFVPKLSEELWQEVLDTCLNSVISSMDKVIQLGYLHQMYYTSVRLFCMPKKTLLLGGMTGRWTAWTLSEGAPALRL